MFALFIAVLLSLYAFANQIFFFSALPMSNSATSFWWLEGNCKTFFFNVLAQSWTDRHSWQIVKWISLQLVERSLSLGCDSACVTQWLMHESSILQWVLYLALMYLSDVSIHSNNSLHPALFSNNLEDVLNTFQRNNNKDRKYSTASVNSITKLPRRHLFLPQQMNRLLLIFYVSEVWFYLGCCGTRWPQLNK